MTETERTPGDYGKDDGYDSARSLDMCPHCETHYSMNSSFYGPVWTQDGTKYEVYVDTDPMDGPFFCEDCWHELETNRKQQENQTLGEFA